MNQKSTDLTHHQQILEEEHGGLASGMLANCREISTDGVEFADYLEDCGFTNSGREYNNTYLNLIQNNPEADIERIEEDYRKTSYKKYINASEKKWAKWFYTDEVGNPVIICKDKY